MSDLTFLEKVKLMPPDYQQEVKDLLILYGKRKWGYNLVLIKMEGYWIIERENVDDCRF